ncbi:MAG TPA: enolase C-terminal domain-like protein [Nocardioidaceae bacterium]|nr:enolase C-terminal domain-like protein [Nocardioidaceae bacterium]
MGRSVEAVTARAYTVPTDAPEADGTATWSSTTMVLVHARCGDVVGTGWTYGPAACVPIVEQVLADRVVGTDPMCVPKTWLAMVQGARNDTPAGAVGYAISAVDVALWDLKARLLGLSLADLFGAARDDVPVYGSGGFTTYDDHRTVAQLSHWVHEQQIPRVKIKIGESHGTAEDRDVHRIRLARHAIGPDAELFVDANGGYTAKQAVRVMRRVDDLDVHWFEEPVSSQDLAGLSEVRDLVDADVAAGEYGTDVVYFGRMCAARAVDCLQVDATRAGGYTAWFQAASVAAAHGLEVSGHCAPNLHAAAALGTLNLRHLEWFHDHARIESMFFDGALDPAGGTLTPDRSRSGHGLVLDEDAAAEYLVL